MKSINRIFLISVIFITFSIGGVFAFSPPESSWVYSSNKAISMISVSNNGQTLIAFDDKSLSILSKDMILTPVTSVSTRIDAIDISSNGNLLVIGSSSNVFMYDESGMVLWKTEIGNRITSVDISSDNNFIAVGTECTKKVTITECYVLYLLDKQGNILWNHLNRAIDSAKLSENGDYIVAVQKTYDNVLLFNKQGDLLWEYKEEYSNIESIAIISDGGVLVSLSDGSVKKLQNVQDAKATPSWVYNIRHNVGGVSVSDDGKYIFTFKQIAEKSLFIAQKRSPTRGIYSGCCYIYILNEDGELLWEEKQDNWLMSYHISSNGRYLSGHFEVGTGNEGISFYDNSINIALPPTTPPPTTTAAPTTTPPPTTVVPTTAPPVTVAPILISKKEGVDTDGDGWNDELEIRIGSNPQNPDSDGDGIIDSKDPNPLKYGEEMGTDSDGDGWSDDLEKKAGTDPFDKDTDGDGLWDSKDPNPIVPEKGEENGINWEAIGVGLAVLAATGGWLVSKRKKRRLKGLLSEIDRTFESSKEDISKCKAELKKLREKSLEALKKDKIDEGSYDILEKRIELCLKELKEKQGVSKRKEVSQCKKCGAHLPIGSYGQVRCEFCNTPNYVPLPGGEEEK